MIEIIIITVILGEVIINVLGFPINSFGFWALFIQLEGCLLIIYYKLIIPFKLEKEASKAKQA